MARLPKPHKCEYCNKGFSLESSLFVHVCEPKRRFLAKNQRHVVLAFDVFQRFYALNYRGSKPKTYEEFVRSPYYTGFVKFGSFLANVNPLYPQRFIDYVIKSGLKLELWYDEKLYDRYVVDLIKNESVETALERAVDHMIIWSKEAECNWNDYFLLVSPNRFAFDTKDGKISPWLSLNSESGKRLLKRLNDDQLNLINSIMDIDFWLSKFKRCRADYELVRQIINEAEL